MINKYRYWRYLPAQHQYTLQTPGLRGCYLAATAWPSDSTAADNKQRQRVWGGGHGRRSSLRKEQVRQKKKNNTSKDEV